MKTSCAITYVQGETKCYSIFIQLLCTREKLLSLSILPKTQFRIITNEGLVGAMKMMLLQIEETGLLPEDIKIINVKSFVYGERKEEHIKVETPKPIHKIHELRFDKFSPPILIMTEDYMTPRKHNRGIIAPEEFRSDYSIPLID